MIKIAELIFTPAKAGFGFAELRGVYPAKRGYGSSPQLSGAIGTADPRLLPFAFCLSPFAFLLSNHRYILLKIEKGLSHNV